MEPADLGFEEAQARCRAECIAHSSARGPAVMALVEATLKAQLNKERADRMGRATRLMRKGAEHAAHELLKACGAGAASPAVLAGAWELLHRRVFPSEECTAASGLETASFVEHTAELLLQVGERAPSALVTVTVLQARDFSSAARSCKEVVGLQQACPGSSVPQA